MRGTTALIAIAMSLGAWTGAARAAGPARPIYDCEQLKHLHGTGLCVADGLKIAAGRNRFITYHFDGTMA